MMLQTAALEHQEQENDSLRQPQAQANQQRGHCYVDAMFAELNEMAMAEQAENNNNEQDSNIDYQDDY
jgi:hypothetical protein